MTEKEFNLKQLLKSSKELFNQHRQETPLRTNRLDIELDIDAFLNRYSVIQYHSTDKKKNIAYEYFSDIPVLSVAGVYDIWRTSEKGYVSFFILIEKGMENDVLGILRSINTMQSHITTLNEYNKEQQKRIVVSLLLNAYGKKQNNGVYNNGTLYISSPTNYGIKKKNEIICLEVSLSRYLELTAKTITLSKITIKDNQDKYKYKAFVREGILSKSRNFNGIVMPIKLDKDTLKKYGFDNIYIKKADYKTKNLVPYWPYDKECYRQGKLFVLSDILQGMKESFSDFMSIDWHYYKDVRFETNKTHQKIEELYRERIENLSFFFYDPFGELESIQTKNDFLKICKDVFQLNIRTTDLQSSDVVISLCKKETEEEDKKDDFYIHKGRNKKFANKVIQHITIDSPINKSAVERIFIEIFVKSDLQKMTINPRLARMMQKWTFYEYKFIMDFTIGVKLSTGPKSTLEMEIMNFMENSMMSESFINDVLLFDRPQLITGKKNYRAMLKGNNVYLIIDTEEVPMPDDKEIELAYRDILTNAEEPDGKPQTISKFKRNHYIHDTMGGKFGFHYWINDNESERSLQSWYYLSGDNKERFQLKASKSLDKMPRARKVIPLHIENPKCIKAEIQEITEMLKEGFGRYDEMMAYPFPFKYTKEYLDIYCENQWGIHWKDVNNKKMNEIFQL